MQRRSSLEESLVCLPSTQKCCLTVGGEGETQNRLLKDFKELKCSANLQSPTGAVTLFMGSCQILPSLKLRQI